MRTGEKAFVFAGPGASQIANVEEQFRLGEMPDANDAVATLIRERYEVVPSGSGEAAVDA